MRRRAVTLAWVLGGLSLALIVATIVLLVLTLDAPMPEGAFGFRGFGLAVAISFGAVGVVLASRVPHNPIGWTLLVAGGIVTPIQAMGQFYAMFGLFVAPGSLPAPEFGAWLDTWIWVPLLGALLLTLLYFPNGDLPSRRWSPVVAYVAVVVTATSVLVALTPGPLESFRQIANPVGVGSRDWFDAVLPWVYLAFGVAFVVTGASLVVRMRRAVDDERAQLRWIALAGLLLPTAFMPYFIVALTVRAPPRTLTDALEGLMVMAIVATAVAIGIAVLKYRLYDIDLVINRAVVLGLLAAFITVVYIGLVVGVGALIGQRGDPVLSAAAAAIVALAFQPARRRAHHVANRFVYGERATPYEALSDFSARVGSAYETDDVLPRMAAVLGESSGAERSEVWLRIGGDLRRVAAWPHDTDGDATIAMPADGLPSFPDVSCDAPVTHRGELLGALTITKPAAESVSPTERRLVADLALQAGFVLRNVRLVEELRASRQRLVRAQDGERRKLERDIHDGAQQQLVALAVKVRLADAMVERDPAKARELLAEIGEETTETLDALRDLARGIFPPLLADKGLTAALQAQARKATVPVEVVADGVGRFPPEVEAAAYFCCLEAMQNVGKYAEASRVEIALEVDDGGLRFEVRDDGRGFDPATTAWGSGLQNMQDRLEALDGSIEIRSATGAGTTAAGWIPIARSSSPAAVDDATASR